MIFLFSQAYIATIVSRSNPSSPNWNVIVKLNDGTGTVDADLSEKVKNAPCLYGFVFGVALNEDIVSNYWKFAKPSVAKLPFSLILII